MRAINETKLERELAELAAELEAEGIRLIFRVQPNDARFAVFSIVGNRRAAERVLEILQTKGAKQ